MPTQVVAPMPVAPARKNLNLSTSQDFFASLNATLASRSSQGVTTSRTIQEDDYTVPAPPPPSPVSFRTEQWHTSLRR